MKSMATKKSTRKPSQHDRRAQLMKVWKEQNTEKDQEQELIDAFVLAILERSGLL
jgi:hypothetical protein